jgi:hypothetical protein
MPREVANSLTSGERCNNVIRDVHDKGARCPNKATHALYNGSRVQSRVCLACARKVTSEVNFLKARPL